MKKILPSLLVSLVIALGAIRATSAFFSDTESSTGNVLQAGKVDLKIDNTSYYNHLLNQGTSWSLNDLTDKLFFNFTDLKPSDIGEDTISLHVDNNNAWACMKVNLTRNADNTCTEPELIDDPTCTNPGEGQGELAQALHFTFWVDDGDNILETGETVFKEGTAQALFDDSNWTLADSSSNLFEPSGPLLGSKTYYIGKAWCFGTLSESPLPQDGFGAGGPNSPANTTGGVTCDGTSLNNATQTDIVMGDISFTAEQSRNNPNFLCNPRSPTPTPSPTPVATPTPTPTPSPTPTDPGERFVDAVTSVLGTFGHCCDVNNLSNDPAVAAASITGAPDSPPNFNFIQISQGSTVTAKFVDNKAVDGPGADIRIHIYDALFPATALVEVGTGPDCSTTTWHSMGIVSDTANVDLDIGTIPLAAVQCIRLTDQGGPDVTFPSLGYDLDAIEALNSIAVP
jgi:predicted ribosomally synthesized peptide with SipW-like signal peptide